MSRINNIVSLKDNRIINIKNIYIKNIYIKMETYIKPTIKVLSTELVCLGPGASDAGNPTVGANSFNMEIDEDDKPTSSGGTIWDE